MGTTFVVNVRAGIDYIHVQSLHQTLDYEQMLHIIREEFATPRPLLEELIWDIEQNVLARFPSLRYFYLSVKKMNPPLGAEVECSEVSVEKHYTPRSLPGASSE